MAKDHSPRFLKIVEDAKSRVCELTVDDVKAKLDRGDEFYLQAREMRPVLADRFIFITGFAADPKINLFLTQTDSKYLVKPFPIQHLINCLKELLE